MQHVQKSAQTTTYSAYNHLNKECGCHWVSIDTYLQIESTPRAKGPTNSVTVLSVSVMPTGELCFRTTCIWHASIKFDMPVPVGLIPHAKLGSIDAGAAAARERKLWRPTK